MQFPAKGILKSINKKSRRVSISLLSLKTSILNNKTMRKECSTTFTQEFTTIIIKMIKTSMKVSLIKLCKTKKKRKVLRILSVFQMLLKIRKKIIQPRKTKETRKIVTLKNIHLQ
jgi:hypothetical protein